MPTYDERLTLLEQEHAQFATRLAAWDLRLERQQFLNDAAQRRHSEGLDRHEAMLATLTQIQVVQQHQLTALTGIAAQHEERMTALQQTLEAIKDLLNRSNGH